MRTLVRPKGVADYGYVVHLLPQSLGDEALDKHDLIIAQVREWGECRVRSVKKRRGRVHRPVHKWRLGRKSKNVYEQKTRIYLKRESDLVMFKTVFAADIWKIFKLIDPSKEVASS